MPPRMIATMPAGIELEGSYVVRLTAVDATTGNVVTGVKISGVVITGNDLTGQDQELAVSIAPTAPVWAPLPVVLEAPEPVTDTVETE